MCERCERESDNIARHFPTVEGFACVARLLVLQAHEAGIVNADRPPGTQEKLNREMDLVAEWADEKGWLSLFTGWTRDTLAAALAGTYGEMAMRMMNDLRGNAHLN